MGTCKDTVHDTRGWVIQGHAGASLVQLCRILWPKGPKYGLGLGLVRVRGLGDTCPSHDSTSYRARSREGSRTKSRATTLRQKKQQQEEGDHRLDLNPKP